MAIILLIASGLFLFTFEATEFNAQGFLLVSLMHTICKYDKFITMFKWNSVKSYFHLYLSFQPEDTILIKT